ncbi:MAG: aldehyde dehydrogenase family protein [Bacteroidia bacterium]|nr:aldehyde dehydrogenase family protein [Bacteroidia bacterium]MDW8056727.1 aldehyde dehydrogenase family protein [Bacteroidia bacterium]
MLQPLLIRGEWTSSPELRPLHSPYSGELLAEVAYARPEHIRAIIEGQKQAQAAAASLPVYKRYEILSRLLTWLEENSESLARLIAQEAAKPLRYARLEIQRAKVTIGIGRDLVRTMEGEILPGDVAASGAGRWILVRRVPSGPLLAITPFNFPLNLVLHKVIPAVVAGTAITLKPAPQAPLTAYRLAEGLLSAGWPPEALSVVLADIPLAEELVRSPAFRILSFTGSAAVGWHLQSLASRKKVILELGGSAAVIVHDPPNLAEAAQAIAEAAYLYAGQVCISVQRIFVQRHLFADFVEAYREAVKNLVAGDPLDEKVHLSSLIDQRSFERVQAWLMEARLGGAKELISPTIFPEKRLILPVLMSEVPEEAALAKEEAFAPFAEIRAYDSIDEAFRLVNLSPYGLQAGIYTQSELLLKRAFIELEVGGVVHNAPPTLRIDSAPYGGVKGSGIGREGVKYATLEYTEPKALLW